MPAKPLASPYAGITPILALVLVAVTVFSIRFGAVSISFGDMASALSKGFGAPDSLNLVERIFVEIRLPRALACIFVGASLAMGGVLMQALFRNPIVEPGLVGTSSGAAFGASLYFVLGAMLKFHAGPWMLPIAACLGGAAATARAFLISETSTVHVRRLKLAIIRANVMIVAVGTSITGLITCVR